MCTKHEVGQLSDEEWNVHRLKKERARDEKTKDKEEAKINSGARVLTIDLQAVKVCPFVQASAIFLSLNYAVIILLFMTQFLIRQRAIGLLRRRLI